MRRSARFGPATRSLTLAGTLLAALATGGAAQDDGLRPPSAFDAITDQAGRSVALFEEAGKVIQHPRCVNCHPAGDRPLQGDDSHPHLPWVRRGEADFGAPAMTCNTCHQQHNVDHAGVPGNPAWALAPIEMAWQGRSLGEICAQIKDPQRNGGKTLAELHEHMAKDSLVGWGWAPGAGRTPAPGSQEVFGRLIGGWIESGAVCPPG
jgi:hypothetical protein